jgi:hypothetical protein
MRHKNQKGKSRASSSSDIYDFSGPLWEKYYMETRKKVKFPRGYKEVSSAQSGF